MVTRIKISGKCEDQNCKTHRVSEVIGVCNEESLKVLKRLAKDYKIYIYNGFKYPFGYESHGLSINKVEKSPKKEYSLNALVKRLTGMRTLNCGSKRWRGGWFGDYSYTVYASYLANRKKILTPSELKKNLLERLSKSYPRNDSTLWELLQVVCMKNSARNNLFEKLLNAYEK